MKRLLISFCDFGLGDAVQFASIVIPHYKFYFPNWTIGVECNKGQWACFQGIADEVYPLTMPFKWRQTFDEIRVPRFLRPEWFYGQALNCPSTKPTRYFVEELRVEPKAELYKYQFHIPPEAQARADKWIQETLPDKPFTIIHPHGDSHPEDKDLTPEQVKQLVDIAIGNGSTPVLLDLAKHPLADDKTVFNPHRWSSLWGKERNPCVATLAGLLKRANYVWGIDSGAEHLASAVGTETLVFWANYHPVFCFDPMPTATHCVSHKRKDDWGSEVREYFEANYDYLYLGENERLNPI